MDVDVDDEFYLHPKVVLASRAARDLYLGAIFYSSRSLSDGFVPAGAINTLDPLTRSKVRATRLAAELVSLGLFEPAEGGYLVHDYLDYQPSRAELERRRLLNAERQKRHRSALVTPLVTRESQRDGESGTRARARRRLREEETSTREESSSRGGAEGFAAVIDALAPSRGQRQRWIASAAADEGRFRACLDAALRRADNPAAYLDELVKSGHWPQETNGKRATKRSRLEQAETIVRNLCRIEDFEVVLGAELDALGVGSADRERLLRLALELREGAAS